MSPRNGRNCRCSNISKKLDFNDQLNVVCIPILEKVRELVGVRSDPRKQIETLILSPLTPIFENGKDNYSISFGLTGSAIK